LLTEGYPSLPVANDVLAEIGGLTVHPMKFQGPNFPAAEFVIDPLLGGWGQLHFAADVSEIIHEELFPLGEWRNDMLVLVSRSGGLYAIGPYGTWRIAGTVEEGINRIVCVDTPVEILVPREQV
jgi:hypothetical protein